QRGEAVAVLGDQLAEQREGLAVADVALLPVDRGQLRRLARILAGLEQTLTREQPVVDRVAADNPVAGQLRVAFGDQLLQPMDALQPGLAIVAAKLELAQKVVGRALASAGATALDHVE